MRRLAIKIGAIFAGWTLLGTFWAVNRSLYRLTIGQAANFGEYLRLVLADYWLWALLTPAIFYLAQKFQFTRRNWLRNSAVHFCGYIALSILHEALELLLHIPGFIPAGFHGSLLKLRVVQSLNEDFWMYWPIVVIWSLVEYYQRYRERDLKASQLSEQLVRAELQALRNQLHPHFLFNALNSITALIHEDIEAADDMLADLAYLLRAYLTGCDEQVMALGREVDLLNTYVRIQQRRFEDRITWVTDIPANLLDAHVPALLLQPLVENAIVHGIAPRSGPGRVQIKARADGTSLRLEVSDDGIGFPVDCQEGVGIANTRARLAQLYGGHQSFDVQRRSGTGTVVRVVLPLRFAGPITEKDLHENTNGDRRRRASGAPEDSVVTSP
jgi:two-component system, LytTR family, sensor kinase